MTTSKHNLTIYQGEDVEYGFPPLYADDGTRRDISSYSVEGTVKRHIDSENSPLASWSSSSFSLSSDGIITLSIDASVTQDYEFGRAYYDLLMTDDSGDKSFPYYGYVSVRPTATS